MKNKVVNILVVAAVIISFMLIVAAAIVSLYGYNLVAMTMFYCAALLGVLAVWIIIYNRGDW